MQTKSFFSFEKEKFYILISFVVLRWLLGYLNHVNFAAKVPFFVNMFLAAVDLVVSLPMKIIFATPSFRTLFSSNIGVIIFFGVMFAYWYFFACVLVHVYKQLNEKDAELQAYVQPVVEALTKQSLVGRSETSFANEKKEEVQEKLEL